MPGEIAARLRVLMPEKYDKVWEKVEPTAMGSAPLIFDTEGRVAWDQIWGSFCDLAMAGGPPHKGALLEPGTLDAIDAAPDRQREVVAEICRGIALAAELECTASSLPSDAGWVRVSCYSERMAQWLLRAITMENVAVRAAGESIDLPAAPHFRLEKEIKNVITVIAKTSHYWSKHTPKRQKEKIGKLLAELDAESPLIEPPRHTRDGWLGKEVDNVPRAIWVMRALVARNVLARREGTTVFLPGNSAAAEAIFGRIMAASNALEGKS